MSARRGWAAAVALLLTGAGATLPLLPAEAASGRCAPGSGVTVVVDYGPLGGGTEIGCDPSGAGDPASEVVPAAGFPLTYASGEPFVCRIKGLPGPADEGCGRTPPPDAYWGLFWSDGESGDWSYASVGVTGLEVPEGGSIGWRFQDGGDRESPGVGPTAAKSTPAPTPKPKPSDKPAPSSKPSALPTQPPSSSPARPSKAPRSQVQDKEPSTRGTDSEKPKETEGSRPKDQGKDKNKGRDKGKDGDDKIEGATPTDSATPSPSAVTTDALVPTSTESAGSTPGNGSLALVAGGAMLLLAGAAGVIGWRRRA